MVSAQLAVLRWSGITPAQHQRRAAGQQPDRLRRRVRAGHRFVPNETAAVATAMFYGLSGYFAAHGQHVGMVARPRPGCRGCSCSAALCRSAPRARRLAAGRAPRRGPGAAGQLPGRAVRVQRRRPSGHCCEALARRSWRTRAAARAWAWRSPLWGALLVGGDDPAGPGAGRPIAAHASSSALELPDIGYLPRRLAADAGPARLLRPAVGPLHRPGRQSPSTTSTPASCWSRSQSLGARQRSVLRTAAAPRPALPVVRAGPARRRLPASSRAARLSPASSCRCTAGSCQRSAWPCSAARARPSSRSASASAGAPLLIAIVFVDVLSSTSC